MDWKFELMIVPVSDVDRAKAFYADQAGFTVDVDFSAGEDFRVVQLTPRGSACSITLMRNTESSTVKGMHLVVTDVDAGRTELLGRGVGVSDIYHFVEGTKTSGLDPQRADYGSFMDFADPDGNTWVVQEVGHAGSGS
ncbi:MAG: VOC family protein [Propionibacteriaceae bacterium]